ncbi:MAG: AbrB/MazE/SpoVT family DNA-binding domain-containing protein [Nanoarchaeota archaeon]
MKRKVITQAGGQAYTITLPIDWIRKNGISEKSELDLTDEGKSIIIRSQNNPIEAKALLNVEDWTERTLYVHLSALYARGIDEIIITSKKDISKGITKSIAHLIGFALVSQQGSTYVIKDISGVNYPHLDEIFKRIFQMILLFYDAAAQDIFGKQQGTLEDLKARDIEVNKFCLYLERAINRMAYAETINGRIIFTYSFMLEKISDEIERLWRANIKYKVKKTKLLKEMIELSKEGLSKAFDLYYQFNSKDINEIYALRDKVREMSFSLSKIDGVTTRFAHHIVKIIEDAADLNHLTSMRALEKTTK